MTVTDSITRSLRADSAPCTWVSTSATTALSQRHLLTCQGTDLQLSEQVAIKLEHIRRGSGKLKLEAEAYRALAGGAGVPRVLWFDEECDYYVLVLDLLGPSLEDLFN